MTWYHGTTKKGYKEIMLEGVIWGKRLAPSRCTYLTPSRLEAMQYGDIVLEIDYDPQDKEYDNNYVEGCWQVREYNPIPASKIVLVHLIELADRIS